MKKIILFLIIILSLSGISYYYYNYIYIPSQKPTLEIEKNTASIDEYYIYGTKLNASGIIKKVNANFKDIKLITWNTKTGKINKYKINYKKNITTVKFNISDEINNGILLDNIKKGTYKLYLRFTYQKKDNKTYKYYSLKNNTNYNKTTYYTTSKYNNKLSITTSDTFKIKVEKNKNETYDIVLDPERGGIDKGATANGTNEANITLAITNLIKEKLEKKNIKVKLTRTKDSLSETDYFDEYNDGGRAVIAKEVNAKYLFSFQVNKSQNKITNGFSIYTAANINYDFPNKIVKNIIEKTNLKTSVITDYRIDNGIYTHNFTEKEISDNMSYYDRKGYKHYKITTKSNYMYMIRESGGIITGAYVDDSNPEKVGVNKYYNSNVGVEAYLIDLGYITNNEDFTAMTTNKNAYAEAIANSIIEKFKEL